MRNILQLSMIQYVLLSPSLLVLYHISSYLIGKILHFDRTLRIPRRDDVYIVMSLSFLIVTMYEIQSGIEPRDLSSICTVDP